MALYGGILLFSFMIILIIHYSDLPLCGYARKIHGNYIGWILSLLYVPFFIYIDARDLRDEL